MCICICMYIFFICFFRLFRYNGCLEHMCLPLSPIMFDLDLGLFGLKRSSERLCLSQVLTSLGKQPFIKQFIVAPPRSTGSYCSNLPFIPYHGCRPQILGYSGGRCSTACAVRRCKDVWEP